ncbi:MAG: hypothetical protein KAQ68_00260 [Clostridiales bacterium]|nr:hypothetical protein [Clostridiales bacterium]
MKKTRIGLLSVSLLIIITSILTSCSLFNPIPKNYTEGIKYDRQYPDHILDIYEDAIVYDSSALFDDVVLSMGTQDDMDEIIVRYRDFLQKNNISPIAYEESMEELYIRFIFDGYEFEIKAEKPEGEHEEAQYKHVIHISTKKTDSKQVSNTANATAAAGSTPAPTANAQNATPAPQQITTAGQDEVPLTFLSIGSWFSASSSYVDGSSDFSDYTFFIKDATNGTLHMFNYQNGLKLDFDFTYVLVNGVLVLYLENGTERRYDAYQYYNTIHLYSQMDGGKIVCLNWEDITGVSPSDSYMSAFGDWIYYDPLDNTSTIMAIWENDGGYMYNLFDDGVNDEVSWTFSNGNISFDHNLTDYTDSDLKLEHRGNVLVATRGDGQEWAYNRVSNFIMAGGYELILSNEPDLTAWVMVLDKEGYSNHTISADGSDFNQDSISWFVDYQNGMLNIMLNGDQHVYYYHFFEEGLYLYEPIEGFFYEFLDLGENQ